MTIQEAWLSLNDLQRSGKITDLQGWFKANRAGQRITDVPDDISFKFDGRVINAHWFGIVTAAYAVLEGKPLADNYDSWGQPYKEVTV